MREYLQDHYPEESTSKEHMLCDTAILKGGKLSYTRKDTKASSHYSVLMKHFCEVKHLPYG